MHQVRRVERAGAAGVDCNHDDFCGIDVGGNDQESPGHPEYRQAQENRRGRGDADEH